MAQTPSNPVKPKGVVTPKGNAPTPPVVKAPAFRIETFETRARFLKMMVYGDYGTGKTHLTGTACQVPEMHDVIMINAESGDLTLQQFAEEHELSIITCTKFKQIARVYEYLRQHCIARDAGNFDKLRELQAFYTGVEPSAIKEPKQFFTVIVDSLTEIEDYCMNDLLGITDITKLDDEVISAEWAEYKKQNSMIRRMIRNFRDLPMHVLFTCAQTYTQDDKKRRQYAPQLTGKLSSQVQGFMDIVGYLVVAQANEQTEEEKKEAKKTGLAPRRLYIQPSPTGKFQAKCRFQYNQPYIDDPHVRKIAECVGIIDAA